MAGAGGVTLVLDGIEHPKKRAFLAAFAECGTVTHAASAAEIGRSTHYEWIKTDERYAGAYEDAKEAAGDSLEAEARRRAVLGVSEPVYYKGEVVGHVQKYSDTLLIFLLKGAKPEKYRDSVNMNPDDAAAVARRIKDALSEIEATDGAD